MGSFPAIVGNCNKGVLHNFILVVDIIVELSVFCENIHVLWILSAFREISTFRGYYPHFVYISVFCGNIHVPWILSAFLVCIRILWKYPRSVDIIRISWKYPRSVDIIRISCICPYFVEIIHISWKHPHSMDIICTSSVLSIIYYSSSEGD